MIYLYSRADTGFYQRKGKIGARSVRKISPCEFFERQKRIRFSDDLNFFHIQEELAFFKWVESELQLNFHNNGHLLIWRQLLSKIEISANWAFRLVFFFNFNFLFLSVFFSCMCIQRRIYVIRQLQANTYCSKYVYL